MAKVKFLSKTNSCIINNIISFPFGYNLDLKCMFLETCKYLLVVCLPYQTLPSLAIRRRMQLVSSFHYDSIKKFKKKQTHSVLTVINMTNFKQLSKYSKQHDSQEVSY